MSGAKRLEAAVLAIVAAAPKPPHMPDVCAALAAVGVREHEARHAMERLQETGALLFDMRLALHLPARMVTR